MKVSGAAPAPVARETPVARDLADPGFAASLDRLLDPRPIRGTGGSAEPELAGTIGGINFSRHARARLNSRAIDIGPDELKDLSTACDRLEERGARESLVLLDHHAFVVGVPTRTVITVLPRAEALGTVFTNIDSTFVAR
ncbi:MAG: hypothetical protein ABMB14_20940 [Myxococcota bacterium]